MVARLKKEYLDKIKPEMKKQFGYKNDMQIPKLDKIEASLHISNVALIAPKSNKPTRVGFKTVGGKKVRVAKRSGEQVE